ncbi:MAG TPA: HDOD domain-containing protein [Polyangiaceae bacterium]|nr:HDOD domain-containing protein [Polyangiaceae bacterium]
MARPQPSTAFALDEDLWFGDGDDKEAESRAAASLAATGARIVGAKPFPIAARRLDELTRNPNTRIEQVVAVLESDPALSARLLRLVNSAGYGLKVRCSSVRHAAVLVGTRRLNQVATTAAILDLFDGSSGLGMELLEHAAFVGSLCRYLAVHLGLPHDELFTCGFLHDIGKLMLLDAERERYAELLQEFGGQADRIHIEERRVFGFDHAVLGAHVLSAWNIPEPVPRVIAWHHAPQRALQDTVIAAMVETLRLSDLLAYVLPTHDAEEGARICGESESARYLDVSGVQLSAMWEDLSALRDRSRARSHGEPEMEAIVPKRESSDRSAPKTSMPAVRTSQRADRPLHEVPTHFPCSVCAKPSYGNHCACCGGHVCPEHQVGLSEWCTTCVREFKFFRKNHRIAWPVRLLAGVAVTGTLVVALFSAARAPEAGIEAWILAPFVVLALWSVVLPVAFRLWQKLEFLEGRRKTTELERGPVARAQTPAPEVLPDSDPSVHVESRRNSEKTLASLRPAPELQDGDASSAPLSLAPPSSPPRAVRFSQAPRRPSLAPDGSPSSSPSPVLDVAMARGSMPSAPMPRFSTLNFSQPPRAVTMNAASMPATATSMVPGAEVVPISAGNRASRRPSLEPEPAPARVQVTIQSPAPPPAVDDDAPGIKAPVPERLVSSFPAALAEPIAVVERVRSSVSPREVPPREIPPLDSREPAPREESDPMLRRESEPTLRAQLDREDPLLADIEPPVSSTSEPVASSELFAEPQPSLRVGNTPLLLESAVSCKPPELRACSIPSPAIQQCAAPSVPQRPPAPAPRQRAENGRSRRKNRRRRGR